MERKNALHTFAVGDLAQRKARIDPGVFAADAHALEGLDALALAFDDAQADAHGVARLEFRHRPGGGELFDLLTFQLLQKVHPSTPQCLCPVAPGGIAGRGQIAFPQIAAALARQPLGLGPAPPPDAAMVARNQHLRHRPALPQLRPGVLRIFQAARRQNSPRQAPRRRRPRPAAIARRRRSAQSPPARHPRGQNRRGSIPRSRALRRRVRRPPQTGRRPKSRPARRQARPRAAGRAAGRAATAGSPARSRRRRRSPRRARPAASPSRARRQTARRRPSGACRPQKSRMSTVSIRHNPARNALPASEQASGPGSISGKIVSTVARQVMRLLPGRGALGAGRRRAVPAAGRSRGVRHQARPPARPRG